MKLENDFTNFIKYIEEEKKNKKIEEEVIYLIINYN
jgi:hypothetical protein